MARQNCDHKSFFFGISDTALFYTYMKCKFVLDDYYLLYGSGKDEIQ